MLGTKHWICQNEVSKVIDQHILLTLIEPVSSLSWHQNLGQTKAAGGLFILTQFPSRHSKQPALWEDSAVFSPRGHSASRSAHRTWSWGWLSTPFLPCKWKWLQKWSCLPLGYRSLFWKLCLTVAFRATLDKDQEKWKESSQNYADQLEAVIPIMPVNANLKYCRRNLPNELIVFWDFWRAKGWNFHNIMFSKENNSFFL